MILKLFIIVVVCVVQEISGNGMMLDPPGRSSVWRYINGATPNYNDNEVSCGGYYVQNVLNDQKCGVCGDRYDDPHPQDNENTGIYGQGIVVAHYKPSETITVSVTLTGNSLGRFYYSICQLPDPNTPEPGEECFKDLLLEDGSSSFNVTSDMMQINNRIVLPDMVCKRCVLRWTYRAGNRWGTCEDGTQAMGCGPQEHYRSCADIEIRNV